MITEVYPCIFLYDNMLSYICIFLNCVLHHVVYSRKPYVRLYYVNLLRYVVFTYLLQCYLVKFCLIMCRTCSLGLYYRLWQVQLKHTGQQGYKRGKLDLPWLCE